MPSIPPFNLKFLANRIDISGSIHALGQGSVGNDFEVGNELTVKNKIIADGDISANKDLIVEGKSTFNDDISMNGHLDARDASFNNITVQNNIYMGQALEVGTVKVVNDISCGTLNSGDVISIDGSFNRLLEVNEISGNTLTFSGSSSVNDLTVNGLLVLAGSFQLPPDLEGANIDLSENLIVSGTADISGHTLMKDVSATNLELSGNLIVDGTTDLSGNVNMGGNLDLSGNLIVDGTTDLSGTVDICGNLNVTGNYNFDGGYLTSHILPSVNAQYDLGSAERKIRHLFLSDNSLWIGDEHKIDVSEGKLRMKKRKKGKAPKRFLGEYNDINKVKNTLSSLGVDTTSYGEISDVKLSDWYKLADYEDISGELFTSDDTGTGDDDFESDEKASKNVLITDVSQNIDGKKTFMQNTIFNDKVGIGTSDFTHHDAKLDVSGSIILSDKIFLRDSSRPFSSGTHHIYGKIELDGNDHDDQCKIIFKTGYNAVDEAMTIKGENVGIGLTNPVTKLDVSGGKSRFTFDSNHSCEFAKASHTNLLCMGCHTESSSSTNMCINTYNPGGNENTKGAVIGAGYNGIGGSCLMFSILDNVNTAQDYTEKAKMVIKGNGNVGIGVTDPQRVLEIAGAGPNESEIIFTNNENSTEARHWRIGPRRTGDEAFQINCGPSQNSYNFNNNTSMFQISSNGNVGIGTTEPGAKLDVNGDFKTDNFEVTGSGSAKGDIIISSAYMVQNVATSDMNGKNCNVIFRRRATGGTNDFYKIQVANSGTNDNGIAKTFLYAFQQDTNNASSGLNTNSYSSIDANNNVSFSGNVGIGTSSPPLGKLHIQTAAAHPLIIDGKAGYVATLIGHGYRWTNTTQGNLSVTSNGQNINNGNSAHGAVGIIMGFCLPEASTGNSKMPGFGVICGNNTDTVNNTNDLCKFFINKNGNVGIGTTDPGYPLQVMNSTTLTSTNHGTAANYYFYRIDGPAGDYGTTSPSYLTNTSVKNYNGNDISIYCEHTVWARYGGFVASSDQRIKENIRDVSDNAALQKLRDISCCFYEYKDKINRTPGTTIGFIAQQVKEHLPIAVSLQKEIIPNEMRLLTDYTWNTLTDASNNKTYKLTINDLSDNSGNTLYCFYVSNDPSGNDEVRKEIKSLEDEPNSFVFDQSWNNVFLYGKEVDDFHTLDKQKLFALNFSATQEIDRIQQAQQTTINNQQITINNQQTTINNQQTTINTLQSTIETLQNTLASFEQRLQQLESN